MIKFFRRIRQQLLSQNKFSKYLLYAIGEILLVVIGILIALQINNWNEGNKVKDQEQIIIKGLLDDFNINRDKFQEYIEFYPNIRSHLVKNLEYFGMTSKDFTEEVKMNILFTFNKEVEFSQGTFNALFNSNKLDLIRNDSLKIKLISYPAHVNRMINKQNDVKNIFLGSHRPLIEEYLSLAKLPGWKELKIGKTFASDYVGLVNDRRYQNTLLNRILISKQKFDAMTTLKEKTEEIIKLLEQSIE